MKIKCLMCEKEFETIKECCTCLDCQEKIKFIKKIEMIDKAKTKLEAPKYKKVGSKKKTIVGEYVEKVKERVISQKDNFDSMPEAMVAIQLEKNGLKYYSQKKIGDCKVDFLITQIKIILEIDGELYHKDLEKSFFRDRRIMAVAGEDWEIVHIDASMVPKYTWNLKEALPFIVEARNDRYMFRNSECDSYFLELFRNFEFQMKVRNERKQWTRNSI